MTPTHGHRADAGRRHHVLQRRLERLVKYLTGFVVEKSLAVDNIFVIAMIFGFFAVPPLYQHRVLFWGILGALLMRGVMIAVGAALITQFAWIIYVFGGFLILTGIKMLLIKSDDSRPQRQPSWCGWCGASCPSPSATTARSSSCARARPRARRPPPRARPSSTTRWSSGRQEGALLATPLLLALVLVEFTDVIFAVDSIPAIFAITTDPFLVFTSNVFAILGLRSLYFALAGMIDEFATSRWRCPWC
jgi:tellurite resistance protein TerC